MTSARRRIALLADEAATSIRRSDQLTRLDRLAHVDALTGAPNRRAWELRAPVLLERSEPGRIAVALLDMDRFKATRPATPRSRRSPQPLTRAETAAEDVIGFLEKGQPAKSQAEARVLRELAHGRAADALRRAGVPEARVKALQQRADRAAKLSLTGARPLRVWLAANSVSQLMPGFYARYEDPVPASVLKLDYLDREIQLRSQAGQQAKMREAVRQLDATWHRLRPPAREGRRRDGGQHL